MVVHAPFACTRGMKILLPFLAIPTFAACAPCRMVPMDPAPVEATAATLATPTAPCRDDENFENGRCVPRIQWGNVVSPPSAR